MTDTNVPTETPKAKPDANPSAPAPKKKRRWPKIILALVVVLVLLVLLLPTILSLSPIRSFVVSQANGYLDGKAEVKSWSLGWFSPVRIEGVRIFDKQNALVLDIAKVETEATLLSLARQNFDLGKTTIIADATKVIVRPDGRTNLHDVFKLHKAAGPKAPTSPHSTAASKLPDVKIDLALDLQGGIQLVDERGEPISMVQIRPGTGGTVKIADINAGIATDMKLLYQVDGHALSTVAVSGTVDPFNANQFDLANLAAQLKLALTQVDLAAAKAGLTIAGVKGVDIGGLANGQIDADLNKGEAGSAKGEIKVSSFVFAAPNLPDRYQPAEDILLPIDVSRVIEAGASRLKVNVQAIAPEMTAAVTGDIPESAISALIAKKMPGADGTLSVTVNADPKAVAKSFPNTLKLLPGVQIDQGQLLAKIDLWLKPESVVYALNTNFQVQGARDGKAISIEPVQLSIAGTVVDLVDPVMGLRNVSLDLKSRFATFTASGPSAINLTGNGQADLDLLRQQAAQFADLNGKQLAGKAVFELTNRQVAGSENQYALALNSTLTGIKASIPNQPPINLPFAKIVASANYALQSGEAGPIKSVDTASVTLLLGNSEAKPLVDALVEITGFDLAAKTIKHFDVKRGTVTSLPELQSMIDPFVPQLREQKITLQNGAVYLAVNGSADLNTLAFVLDQCELSVPSLQVLMDGKEVLNERKIGVVTAGKIVAGEKIVVDLSNLSVDSSIATLTSNQTPLQLTFAKGMPTGSGKLNTIINFVPLNRIAQAFSTQPINTVSSGQLTGNLVFASDGDKPTANFDGKIDGLSIDQTPISNESITISFNAITDMKADALQSVAASANIKGSFLSLMVKDTTLRLAKDTPLLKMVESASIVLGVPDAQKAVAVAKSLVPGLSLPYTPAGGVAITAEVTGGNATVDLKASRLTLTDDATKRVYRFDPKKPVSLVAALQLVGVDKIESVKVTSLTGDLDLVQIAMLEPVVIDDPMGDPSPRGKIRINGAIERITPFLQFVQAADKPLPYRGLFEINPTLSSKNQIVKADLNGSITDFVMLNDAGQAAFTEKEVKLTGDLSADLKNKIATIRTLNIEMNSSKAATINLNGAVRQYDSAAPVLDGVVVKVNAIGEKAWPILFPLLPPEQQAKLQTAKLVGPIVFDLTANGAYLKDKPTNEAIKPLTASGELRIAAADLNDAYGLDVKNLIQFFSLEKGILVTGQRNADGGYTFAPAFDVNGGKGDLGSVVINIGHPDMLVSIGRKQKLLTGVRLNPVMAAQLGSLASVMFKDSKKASGIVDVIVVDCTNVPLNDLLSGSKRAKAEILYNVKDLRLDGSVPSALSSILQWGDQGIVGKIENGSLVLSDGIAYQNMTIDILKVSAERDVKTGEKQQVEAYEQLTFKGGIGLENQKFVNYTLWMSKGLLLADWRKSFPNGATVPLKGNVADVNGILAQTIGGLAVQGFGGSLLDDLFNKAKDKKKEQRDR